MSLYTRKKGEYTRLTRAQVRRLRRVNEVNELLKWSRHASTTLHALEAFLERVDRRANKIAPSDMVVARLPNRVKLAALAMSLRDAANKVQGM